MKITETNVLGLPGLKVVDAELLKKWRFGFEPEGSPDEDAGGTDDPPVPDGEEGLGGDPPFEESADADEEFVEPEVPETEAASDEEFVEPEPPVEDPMDDPASV